MWKIFQWYVETEQCRFGDSCERDFCMYQHNVKVSVAEVIDIMSEVEDIGEDEKCEEEEIKANDKNDITFMNPSQSDSSITDNQPFNCDLCDKKNYNKTEPHRT